MNKNYKFYNPVRINFGSGARKNILNYLESKKCLIVCSNGGATRLREDSILDCLSKNQENIWEASCKMLVNYPSCDSI